MIINHKKTNHKSQRNSKFQIPFLSCEGFLTSGAMFEKRRKFLPVFLSVIFGLCIGLSAIAQPDSTIRVDKKVVTLKEVVVRSNLNVPAFIDRVKNDTSFHKA